jgi:SWI/SNF-related matrix-associated actin-dependent regulator of chromatin subfamily B protein 1
LDIKVDNICLKDRFEWDINDPENSPEDFAYSLAEELNLNGEFVVKIAHQIREQLLYYRKNYHH